MKKWMIMLLCVMMAATVLSGCGGQEEPASNEPANEVESGDGSAASASSEVDYSEMLEVKGSDTMVNLGQAWAEEFMNQKPEAMISVTGGGSGTGAAALINGTADVAMMSRSMKDEEFEQANDNGIEVTEVIGGMDGVAVVVHVDNPVDTLTIEQIKGLYTGEITNWSEVGGEDMEVGLYSRDTSSGTYVFFKEFVLDDEDYSDDSMLMPSTQAIVEGVIQDEGGIGYIGLGYLDESTKAVSVSMDGGEAFMPEHPEYPVARPLFFYIAGEAEGLVGEFVDFILSGEGQQIVSELGFIPLD